MPSNNDRDKRDERGTAQASPDPGPQPPASLDALIEALTTFSGTLQRLAGPELRDHVTDVQTQVRAILRSALRQDHGAGAGTTAAQVKRLIETVTTTGTGTTAGAEAAAPQGKASAAFLGVDLSPVTDGLRVLTEWLQNPIDGGQAEVEQLIAKLNASMGPVAGGDERGPINPPDKIKNPVKSPFDHLFDPKPEPDPEPDKD